MPEFNDAPHWPITSSRDCSGRSARLRGLQFLPGAPGESGGIAPDAIQHLDDLKRLPFTTTDDLRDFYPFPLRSVPFEQIVRIHASSGTTGKRKIIGYTQKDLDDWVHFFARCYEMAGVTPLDRVQIAVGYGIWTAGMGFQLGCEKVGAMAVPVGPGNLDMHLQFMEDIRSTVFAVRRPWPCSWPKRSIGAASPTKSTSAKSFTDPSAPHAPCAAKIGQSCSAAPSCSTSPVSPSSMDPAPESNVRP
jgi:hypothetical protein